MNALGFSFFLERFYVPPDDGHASGSPSNPWIMSRVSVEIATFTWTRTQECGYHEYVVEVVILTLFSTFKLENMIRKAQSPFFFFPDENEIPLAFPEFTVNLYLWIYSLLFFFSFISLKYLYSYIYLEFTFKALFGYTNMFMSFEIWM